MVDFAELAVELRVLYAELKEAVKELEQQSDRLAQNAQKLEYTVAMLQVTAPIYEKILVDARRRAWLVHQAHVLLRALIPHEQAVRKIVEAPAMVPDEAPPAREAMSA